jgi:cardiolipin synthase
VFPARLARWIVLALSAGSVALGVVGCERKDDDTGFQLRVPVPNGDAFGLSLYQSLGVELLPGHQVELLDNGAIFDGLEKAIGSAKRSVHALLYIWEKGAASDRVTAALVERAKSGARCRVLVDAFGSPDFGKDVAPRLTSAGCEVRVFRPLLEQDDELARNHRKIVVVDGRVAFTGGFGIRDNWLGDGVSGERWRDANVRFTGPAVRAAQQAFAENWQEAGGEFLPADAFPPPETAGAVSAAFVSSTSSPVLTRTERLVQLLVQSAHKRLWIANAYFVPSDAILELLKHKAEKGVDVRLLAPGKKSDSKTSFGAQHIEYGSLLEKRIRIFEYQPSMMHSKTMLVDDDLALVSSMNLDPLSLTKLEEAALVVQDRTFTAKLAQTFEADCKRANELKR